MQIGLLNALPIPWSKLHCSWCHTKRQNKTSRKKNKSSKFYANWTERGFCPKHLISTRSRPFLSLQRELVHPFVFAPRWAENSLVCAEHVSAWIFQNLDDVSFISFNHDTHFRFLHLRPRIIQSRPIYHGDTDHNPWSVARSRFRWVCLGCATRWGSCRPAGPSQCCPSRPRCSCRRRPPPECASADSSSVAPAPGRPSNTFLANTENTSELPALQKCPERITHTRAHTNKRDRQTGREREENERLVILTTHCFCCLFSQIHTFAPGELRQHGVFYPTRTLLKIVSRAKLFLSDW